MRLNKVCTFLHFSSIDFGITSLIKMVDKGVDTFETKIQFFLCSNSHCSFIRLLQF